MIFNFIVDVFVSIIDRLLAPVPEFDLTTFNEVWGNIISIIRSVCYFLPMDTVSAIFSIIISLATFRIVVAILKTIWSVLPLL